MTKFFWIILFFSVNLVFCQKPIIEYYNYSNKNGLVNNWVNDFEKDRNGFIWIATNDGISRFDGYNFINFSSENHSLIPINSSFQDIQIHGDLIYAISNEKGVFTINTSNLKVDKIISKGVSSYCRKENLSLIYYTSGTLVFKNKDRIVSVSFP